MTPNEVIVSEEATSGMSVGWRFIVISRYIGHGGGGVKLNADGPRPLARWTDKFEICIRSGIVQVEVYM